MQYALNDPIPLCQDSLNSMSLKDTDMFAFLRCDIESEQQIYLVRNLLTAFSFKLLLSTVQCRVSSKLRIFYGQN